MKSRRDFTAMKTMEARTALGMGRKAGVRKRRTIKTKRVVKMPWRGVHSVPQEEATRAEREREPEVG